MKQIKALFILLIAGGFFAVPTLADKGETTEKLNLDQSAADGYYPYYYGIGVYDGICSADPYDPDCYYGYGYGYGYPYYGYGYGYGYGDGYYGYGRRGYRYGRRGYRHGRRGHYRRHGRGHHRGGRGGHHRGGHRGGRGRR